MQKLEIEVVIVFLLLLDVLRVDEKVVEEFDLSWQFIRVREELKKSAGTSQVKSQLFEQNEKLGDLDAYG